MACNRFRASQSGISTGTSAKTLLQVVAAAQQKVAIDGITVSFQGTSNTATPVKVRVLRQTSAGTMSSLAGRKDPDDWGETMQTTFQHTATAEPAASDVLMEFYVHPQTGWDWQAPFGRPLVIGGGDRVGVEVTAAADVNATVTITGEE